MGMSEHRDCRRRRGSLRRWMPSTASPPRRGRPGRVPDADRTRPARPSPDRARRWRARRARGSARRRHAAPRRPDRSPRRRGRPRVSRRSPGSARGAARPRPPRARRGLAAAASMPRPTTWISRRSQARGELDAGDEVDAVQRARSACLFAAGRGVVVGEREHGHAACRGQRHQFAGREYAVGVAAVGMQIDEQVHSAV